MKNLFCIVLTAVMCVSTFAQDRKMPVMGERTVMDVNIEEFSGLCMAPDGSYLLACGDGGVVNKLSFDGEVTDVWSHKGDTEGITIDPTTGHIYLAIERTQNVYRVDAPDYKTHSVILTVQEAVDGRYWNDGLEAVEYYKDDILFVGSQRNANLWQFKTDGTMISKISLSGFAKEIAGLCYDPVADWLWVVDSIGFKIYICTVDGELLATYDVSDIENAESICIDRERNCVWVGSDEDYPKVYRYSFEF